MMRLSLRDPHGRLTVGEVQSLADRLAARGTSRLLRDQPEMQVDMRTAARVIQTFVCEIDRASKSCSDPVCRNHLSELSRELLLIDVDGTLLPPPRRKQ